MTNSARMTTLIVAATSIVLGVVGGLLFWNAVA